MKLHILSDLHLEFGELENCLIPDVDRDILILAGDIGVGQGALDFIRQECEKSVVIYVLGNHEYYQHSIEEVDRFWTDLKLPNLHVLHNSSIIMDNIKFIGAPLWTNFNNQDLNAMNIAYSSMNDYAHIKFNDGILAPIDTYFFHDKTMKYLDEILSIPFDGKKVVITHHLPSKLGVHPKYGENELNHAFYSDLDQFILKTQPDLWIHGHTHDTLEYQIGDTPIICNPRGYFPYDLNEKFDPGMIYKL